jgi:hypothetical protein
MRTSTPGLELEENLHWPVFSTVLRTDAQRNKQRTHISTLCLDSDTRVWCLEPKIFSA